MKSSWTRKEVSKITSLPDRRVLFYTEQMMLPGFNTTVGRGTAREYSIKDIFYLLLIKELASLGLSLAPVRAIIMSLHAGSVKIVGESTLAPFPKLWTNGAFTKETTIMILSRPENANELCTVQGSKNYGSEIIVTILQGVTELKMSVDKSSYIVMNLNRLFEKAKL